MPTTLQSTGTARRWAKNTLSTIRNTRGNNESLNHTRNTNNTSEMRTLGPSSPLHGPGAMISGTLPRRRRKHVMGVSSKDRVNDKGGTTAPQSSSSSFESLPGPTARWQASHKWIPHPSTVSKTVDTSRIWERPRHHKAPEGVPLWQTAVLRTRLLEPGDPLPRHKTRKELLRTLHKKKCIAHESFDLDGDGVVSITDYKLAKDMDIDGSGHIDDEETRLGRTKLARNFYETKNMVTSRFHRRNWREMDAAAKEMVKKKNFGQCLTQMRQGLWIRQGRSGRRVVDSLSFDGQYAPSARFGKGASTLQKCNKRSELKNKRRELFLREALESCKRDSHFFQPVVRYGRQSLLTDMRRLNHNDLNGDKLRDFGVSQTTLETATSSRSKPAMKSARRHIFGCST